MYVFVDRIREKVSVCINRRLINILIAALASILSSWDILEFSRVQEEMGEAGDGLTAGTVYHIFQTLDHDSLLRLFISFSVAFFFLSFIVYLPLLYSAQFLSPFGPERATLEDAIYKPRAAIPKSGITTRPSHRLLRQLSRRFAKST